MLPNYEFNLPKAMNYSLPVTVIGIITIAMIFYISPFDMGWNIFISIPILVIAGAYVALVQYIKYFTNVDRRIESRDRLLNSLNLRGNENILDIGCGNGILILGAAKKLTSGKAIGTDIWTENSGDNKKEIFDQNAKIEGVSRLVSLVNEDARSLSFKDGSFDLILCGLTMHHILHDDNPSSATAEMSRVLKPDGLIAIYDVPIAIKATKKLFLKQGMDIEYVNSNLILCKKYA